MSQLVFQNDKFLSKKDIKVGHVYIKKEGILLLYILAKTTSIDLYSTI